MSDKLAVRALQPIYDHRTGETYAQDAEFETDRDFIQSLIDINQAVEIPALTLITVPEMGLYLPDNAIPDPVVEPVEADKKKK